MALRMVWEDGVCRWVEDDNPDTTVARGAELGWTSTGHMSTAGPIEERWTEANWQGGTYQGLAPTNLDEKPDGAFVYRQQGTRGDDGRIVPLGLAEEYQMVDGVPERRLAEESNDDHVGGY